MKNPKQKKNNLIILICLIASAVIATATVIPVCTWLFVVDETFNAGDLSSAIVATISFDGAIILGTISFWQTKSANAISETLSMENMRCDITFLGDVKLTLERINSARLLEFAKSNETEGLFCSTDDKQALYYHSKDDYLCLELCFTTKPASIEKMKIEKIYFCKTFENDSAHKDYFLKFNIFNDKNKVVFSYNPARGCYVLFLYLNCDKNKLKEINDNNYFVIDFSMEAESNYKAKQSLEFSLNFIKVIGLDDLLNGRTKKIERKLESVIVHKGEIKYE